MGKQHIKEQRLWLFFVATVKFGGNISSDTLLIYSCICCNSADELMMVGRWSQISWLVLVVGWQESAAAYLQQHRENDDG
jgi:hypothetical protein